MITIRDTRVHPPGRPGSGSPPRPGRSTWSVPSEQVDTCTRALRSRYAAGRERVRDASWNAGCPAIRWPGAVVRRLRIEHGPGPDEGARSALADGGRGVVDRLAADV